MLKTLETLFRQKLPLHWISFLQKNLYFSKSVNVRRHCKKNVPALYS